MYKIVGHNSPNGNMVRYKVTHDNTWYHAETPDDLIVVLEHARENKLHVRVWYGDTETGRDWMEEYNVTGRISRSTGHVQIPILLANTRSYGGPGLLDHCIVKLVCTETRQVLWVHPKYQIPVMEIKLDVEHEPRNLWTVSRIGEPGYVAQFKTRSQAERWADFMLGRRLNR